MDYEKQCAMGKAMCYGTLATSTLIIIILRNVENFKVIKIRKK
jgi:hypothetical protein